ncbi:hypothetical protein RYX36_008164 [Vicia faba]
MDGKENSKVHHQQKLQHFEEKEKYTSSSFSLTPREESSIESTSSSSNAMDDEEEEISLNELLLDANIKKKIELLAAMVGVDTTEPAIVLSEVVRVLKALKAISHY